MKVLEPAAAFGSATLLRSAILLASVVVPLASCVTEKVRRTIPPLSQTLRAGACHGVNLYFEVDPGDIPELREWIETQRSLPPALIVPHIEPGGREVYGVGSLHRVDFHHSMFEVGGYRYPPMPRAHLHVYKRREGNFAFGFRDQSIIVPSDVPWVPAVYYYSIDEEGPGGRILTKEVVQVGLATVETVPEEGCWLVNGRKYYPDPSRPLELQGAVHAQVAR